MAKSHKKKRLESRFGKKAKVEKIGVALQTVVDQTQQTSPQKTHKTYYKQLLIIPFLMLLAAFIIIGVHWAQTGDFVNRGISLKGGTAITLTSEMLDVSSVDAVMLASQLEEELPGTEYNIRIQRQLSQVVAVEIESGAIEDEEVDAFKAALVTILPELDEDEVGQNVRTSGSTLGASFFKQILWAVVVAFVLMGIVVFIQFKVPVPSLAVILAAFSDIVVTLAVINIMGIKLSTAGIAAFLMLIGYSVDTDILLSTRVLKNKKGTVKERVHSAMRTGLTMNITTLAAISVGLLVSESQVITQIMTILFIGLLVDMVNTWIQNAGILRWYAERAEKKAGEEQ